MRLKFFPITKSDEPFLLTLYASTRSSELELVPWDDDQKNSFIESQFLSQYQHYLTTYPEALFQKITFEDKNIGRLYICELENEIRIIDLTISHEFRGRGFGTEIISDILQTAAKPVRIYLENFNSSAGLFKRLGFRLISDEGIYHLLEHDGKKSLAATSGKTKKGEKV